MNACITRSDLSVLRQGAVNCKVAEWRPLLEYHAKLHQSAVQEPANGLPYQWECIGPGYCCGEAFGHWDIIHEVLDAIPVMREFACKQLMNNLEHQQESGFLPGSIWMKSNGPDFSKTFGHPPLWIFAVDDYDRLYSAKELLAAVLPRLLRQIRWFEENRKAIPHGYYYLDILTNDWESGVDEGVRFDNIQTGALACIDATCHVCAMYQHAARWSQTLEENGEEWKNKAESIASFVRDKLYDSESQFFYDIWSAQDAGKRHLSFEGFWPLVCGIASAQQANNLIDHHLLNDKEFLTNHPVPSVAISDPLYEHRMWRGPAWNSMTYWIARGCVLYQRHDAAATILKRALDVTALQYKQTGTVWEFYHSCGGEQTSVQRKPNSPQNTPCRDYLGHNPLFAMARLYQKCIAVAGKETEQSHSPIRQMQR